MFIIPVMLIDDKSLPHLSRKGCYGIEGPVAETFTTFSKKPCLKTSISEEAKKQQHDGT